MVHIGVWKLSSTSGFKLVFGLFICLRQGQTTTDVTRQQHCYRCKANFAPKQGNAKTRVNSLNSIATLLFSSSGLSLHRDAQTELVRLQRRRRRRLSQIHASEGDESDQVPLETSAGKESPPKQTRTYSSDWSGSGKFADEDPLPLSFWLLGPNPRRAILPTILIWGIIAPAVNLYGSGSFLCSLVPKFAQEQRLDSFYPVSERRLYPYDQGFLDYSNGFKRYVDDVDNSFEFRYPAIYVQDQTVYLQNVDRAFAARTMDPQGVLPSSKKYRNGPLVAFGPQGESGEENLSVVAGSIPPEFTLKGTFGSPTEGADRLIQSSIAKPGVREVTLLNAFERQSAKSGKPLYQFEYRVDFPGIQGKEPVYTICVVGASKGTLFTFASRVPSVVWQQRADTLREAANSFILS